MEKRQPVEFTSHSSARALSGRCGTSGLYCTVLFVLALAGSMIGVKAGEPIHFSSLDSETRMKVSIPRRLTIGNNEGQANELISLLQKRSGAGPDIPLAAYWGADMGAGAAVSRSRLENFLNNREEKLGEMTLDDYFGNTSRSESYWSEEDSGQSSSSSRRSSSSSPSLEDFYLESLERDSQKTKVSQNGSSQSSGNKWGDAEEDPYGLDTDSDTSGANSRGGWGAGVQSFQAGGLQDTTSQESASRRFVTESVGLAGKDDEARAAQGFSVHEAINKTGSAGVGQSREDEKVTLANGMEATVGSMKNFDGSSTLTAEQKHQNTFMKVFNKNAEWSVEDYWSGGSGTASLALKPTSASAASKNSLAPEDGSSLLPGNLGGPQGFSATSPSVNGASTSGFLSSSSGGIGLGTAAGGNSLFSGNNGQQINKSTVTSGQAFGPSFNDLLQGSASGANVSGAAGGNSWLNSGPSTPAPSLRAVPSVLQIPRRPGLF